MKISIIIPNYNGKKLLEKNLTAVLDAQDYFKDKTGNSVEVLIVDDASIDGSVEFLKQQKRIKIVQNSKNLGFSSTVNIGVRESEGEIVVLLNTDVIPEKDFLILLISHFSDEKVFAVGCMDKSIEKDGVILRGRGLGQWKRGFLVHSRGEVNKTNTLWVSGGSGAFRKSVWVKLGGLNQLYNPFYWEDIDLSYRALKSGYKVLFEQKSIVTHKHEEGIIKKKYTAFAIKTIAYKNQFIFVWENATDLDLQLTHLLFLPYHFLTALMRLDMAFFLGFIQAFILFPKIIQSSFNAQRHFLRKDKDIMKEFLE